MTLRQILAERVSPLKKRLKIQTPVISEVALPADILSSLALELTSILGQIPVICRGKAYGEVAGTWYHVPFTKSLYEPSVVAVAEGRAGAIPSVVAPTIVIGTVDVAAASVDVATASVDIATASVAVPAAIPVDIPTTVIPYLNEYFPYLVSDVAWVQTQICNPVNKIVEALYRVQSRINDTIGRINDGFNKTKTAVQNTNSSISDLRGKSETAINSGLSKSRDNAQKALNSGLSTVRDNTQKALNAGFSKVKDNTQSALNTTIGNTQSSVNKGLASLIPALYAAWGLPSTMIITPIHVRNVTSSGFDFQSYGKTTCYYIAVGSRG